MTGQPGQRCGIRFQPAARRAIAARLPESVAAAVIEFCDSALAENPHRAGKPLIGPLCQRLQQFSLTEMAGTWRPVEALTPAG